MNIDFIVPWVDGSDENWLLKKRKYEESNDETIDNSADRYRNWDLLKFWFRGVERFAPWVHKIFFVSDHQIPTWLNVDHPKLKIVLHEEFIPNKYLPVFSSHPIELNFHRISDLSEYFVYFNDDMFLTSEVYPEDFFIKKLPCGLAVESPVTPEKNDIFNHILLNDITMINEKYRRKEVLKKQKRLFYSKKDFKGWAMNKCLSFLKRDAFFGFEYSHLSSSFLKSSFVELWNEGYDWLDSTCSHHFRNIEDVNQYVFLYHQFVNGNFIPKSWRKFGKAYHIDDSLDGNVKELCDAIRKQKFKEVCVNERQVNHFKETQSKVYQAFSELLPQKSSFENK
ncbi:stealth family protein [Pseudoramibacter faecis]|uniref:stealth family protein n=1 Tax=Pseudoramibacter faecis TaxID=3108534 RepID=UPI002E761E52|nr:stealth family protein [Pseudoramibacter sp. HA2172]